MDRLLRSPRRGEHMARLWLDAARYADTNGYFTDRERQMWLWRDWVVGAFNHNMPFDRFTVEQLAGDLLPHPTVDQRIATGFHRNNMVNDETGLVPEEYRVEYVLDRIRTTSTVWLGLTLGCAQCHDHKYDPLSQKEFYGVFALFNNMPEDGLFSARAAAALSVRVPTRDERTRLAALDREARAIEARLSGPLPALDRAQAAWEDRSLRALPGEAADVRPAARGPWYEVGPFTGGDIATALDAVFSPENDKEKIAWRPASEIADGKPYAANGPAGAVYLLREIEAPTARTLRFEVRVDAPFKVWLDGRRLGSLDVGDQPEPGVVSLAVALDPGKHQLLVKIVNVLGNYAFTLDWLDEVTTSGSLPVLQALAVPRARRTPEQISRLRDHYRSRHLPRWKDARKRLGDLVARRKRVEAGVPTSLVMGDLPRARDTFVLQRGQYDKRGERVEAGVPSALPPLPEGAPRNRLGLARWLVDAGHPLTARVAVNRLWQQFFGTGLVKTAEDFGAQGEWPSHPELLDWLATELVRSSWDVAHLQRLIVGSATYRQTSRVTPQLLEKDPENRLLARGARFRLDAEILRDGALAIAGLLAPRLGGPSVRPYQPAGLWNDVVYDRKNQQHYQQDRGEGLYRRSLYTFWKRQVPPPSMLIYDAPTRETCTVRRQRTNTPLQALARLNDPQLVEASRVFAQRLLREVPSDAPARIDRAFRIAVARPARASEIASLSALVADQRNELRGDPAAARALLAVGESPPAADLDAVELAAWTQVAALVLNLDETMTRE